jgi:hypothetical protein
MSSDTESEKQKGSLNSNVEEIIDDSSVTFTLEEALDSIGFGPFQVN